MSTELLRPHIPVLIESFEQGLCDKHPELVQLVTDKIMEQYDRIVGTDHSGCVIFETGDLTDKNPYNVVIQALYNQMTNWYGGETIVNVAKMLPETRGFVINFRELRGTGKAIGFLIHMVPVRVTEHNALPEEANYFLILHSIEDSTMESIEEKAVSARDERLMFEREMSGILVQTPTGWADKPLYETTPSHPLPIEGGGELTSRELKNPMLRVQENHGTLETLNETEVFNTEKVNDR